MQACPIVRRWLQKLQNPGGIGCYWQCLARLHAAMRTFRTYYLTRAIFYGILNPKDIIRILTLMFSIRGLWHLVLGDGMLEKVP